MHHWYEALGVRPAGGSTKLGLLDLEDVEVPADAQVYLCGPLPFMESVRRSLLLRDIPDRNIKYEVFGPDTWLAGA
jgi:nitric oxide dioxygenase